MKKFSLIAAALSAALAAATATPAQAAVEIVIEGGGTPIVFEGDNGNRFAVLGIDARRRDADNIVNLADFTVDLSFLQSRISPSSGGGARLVNAFVCPDFAGGASCSPLTSITVSDEARLFSSLLLEFNGSGNIVLTSPFTSRTSTLNLGVTQVGGPPILGAVPEPTTWAMMLLGFFTIGAALRRRGSRALKPSFA